MVIEICCLLEPLPIDIVEGNKGPFEFGLKVLFEGWDQDGLAICHVVLLMDGTVR
jgi:hypothetical protein